MENIDIEHLYELYSKCSSVCTDTRKIVKGGMFFALRGENFNGNDFAVAALNSGASMAVIDDAGLYEKEEIYRERLILTGNTLETLQKMAKYHRLRYRLPVIALTGTNGKTTTKELIAAVLSTKYNVVSTSGNFNNAIGVPLTMLKINGLTQIAVVEMGASHPGEIKELVNLVCPSFGIITSIGKAHLEFFGSIEGVKKTKGELYDYLNARKKLVFINMDNPVLTGMARTRTNMRLVPYGLAQNGARILNGGKDNPYLKMVILNPSYSSSSSKPSYVLKTNLIGNYNADNVLAALSVATYFAVPTAEAVKAISDYVPSNNRSQMKRTGRNTLIIDAYNANPTSMKAALENFGLLNFDHKMMILGDMLELGDNAVEEHEAVIEYALSLKPESLVLVGEIFRTAYERYFHGDSQPVSLYPNVDILLSRLSDDNISGMSILIKGSHGIHLEKTVEFL
ncbi:MAG: UDP-N-acetylmuramoyl-tripeptide--D-alanyl-D-alanine ligase [Bacteroidales bacterium]|jgi:UDP-N-acetylmuramoyl-tripeptide--D-alanyl-D-alanine ligase|nr:UDP-N-acetylmuramoyl-tripeptide--D-alanyl-D-alanine ligase [Bacteroidales bacterium]